MSDWTTVRYCSTVLEANYQRSLLEMEGIEVFLQDEHTIGTDPMWNVAMGGIKLQVHEREYGKALTILHARDAEQVEDPDEEDPRCPKCGSFARSGPYTTLRTRKSILGFVLGALLVGVPAGQDQVYECVECRTRYPVDGPRG